ncbi:hypothetical protein ACU4GD_40070 [Cupriavidus basilensis]
MRIHHARLRRLLCAAIARAGEVPGEEHPRLCSQMAMQYMTLGTQEMLRDQIVMAGGAGAGLPAGRRCRATRPSSPRARRKGARA